MKNFKILKTTELPDSEVEIEAEIGFEEVNKHRSEALEKISQSLKIDGFRTGHIPEKVIVEKVGEGMVLEEAAEIALQSAYGDILKESKLDIVGNPSVSITKLAKDNPLQFKLRAAIVPKVTLPNYKKIAKEVMSKEEKVEVSEKDVEDALTEIQRNVAHQEHHATHDDAEHSHGDLPLPELNDEFIKKLGDFKNLNDLKEKLRTNIKSEKEFRARDKKRVETIEKIIAESKIDVPKILVESELEKMVAGFKDNVAQMGIKPEQYMAQIKKTDDDLKKEWQDEGVKRAKIQLILNQIALDEKLEVDKERLEKEVAYILESYKEAEPLRARIYVETILTNEKVWEFLESQK